MKKKISFIVYMFFILVYGNQGFSDLPGQCMYYLTRESWKLSATMLGLLAFLTSLAWYCKPIFGYLADYFGSRNKLKTYLIINTILIILASLYIVIFGINIITLIIIFSIINFAIAGNDVSNDKEMCILEKKYCLSGRIQAVQWTALGIAGLIVALLGAYIANTWPNEYNYRIAYAITIILPMALLIYLIKYYKPEPAERQNINRREGKANNIANLLASLKNKEFIIGILFIFFLRFSPSFGTALTIHMREAMGIHKMFLGYLGATGTVLGIIGYILYYWKGYKVNLRKMLYFTIVFSALTNLCYLYLPNKWMILTYNIAFGAIDGMCFLAIMAFMAKIVPSGYEGMSYAIIASISNLSARCGGILGGVIYDKIGYDWNVIIASLTTALCIFFIPFLRIKKDTCYA
jgi:MFS family permease